MINISRILAFVAIALTMSACEPKEDRLSLEPPLDKSKITFTVTTEGNNILVNNTTPGVLTYWDYGSGYSNNTTDTFYMAFSGDYNIYLTVLTAGGTVELDPVVATIENDDPDFFNDPLWYILTNGNEGKTWVLDIEAKYFHGPLFFADLEVAWTDEYCEDCHGELWYWHADIAGNSWIMPIIDYGSMTFIIDQGLYVSSNRRDEGVSDSGTFMLDVVNKTLTLTGTTIVRDAARIDQVSNWTRNLKILTLTEDYMQIGVVRDKSDEGELTLVYNYISYDYYDNN